jgi:hypothetical protein
MAAEGTMARTRIDWKRLQPARIAEEAAHAALVVLALALGWLDFPSMLVLLCLELVATVALSARFLRERDAAGHVADTLKMLAGCVFLSLFQLAAYAGSDGFADGYGIDAQALAVLVALALLRLVAVAWSAQRSADPRREWARAGLMRGGLLLVALVLGAFAAFVPGLLLAGAAAALWPDVGADVALGATLLAVQVFIAAVVSTMTDAEFDAIVQQPYLPAPSRSPEPAARRRTPRRTRPRR